jgi:hypothetical protein
MGLGFERNCFSRGAHFGALGVATLRVLTAILNLVLLSKTVLVAVIAMLVQRFAQVIAHCCLPKAN